MRTNDIYTTYATVWVEGHEALRELHVAGDKSLGAVTYGADVILIQQMATPKLSTKNLFFK